MKCLEAMYTEYHAVRQCPPMCIMSQFTKLIVHQIFRVYGSTKEGWYGYLVMEEGISMLLIVLMTIQREAVFDFIIYKQMLNGEAIASG